MHSTTDTLENYGLGQVLKAQKDDTFHQLVKDLTTIVAQSPGSKFLDIDPRPIIKLMAGYKSNTSDWEKYAHRNENQCFTRNLVDRGNDKCNVVCPDWPQKKSRMQLIRVAYPSLEPGQRKSNS